VPWEGKGYKPVGYGFDSISATINTIHRIENEVSGLSEDKARNRRQSIIREVDERGIIATPSNSSVNELVVEAARASILKDGEAVHIDYSGTPHVVPRS
jgi:methionine aminopeptidase